MGQLKDIKTDHTLFIKFPNNGKFATLIVQVDNIIFSEDDIDEIGRVKEKLAVNFKIKDLEFQRYFIGIEIVNQKRESLFPNKNILQISGKERNWNEWLQISRYSYRT